MTWLIALKGLSGCGKSTLARALSRSLGWPLIDKDDVKDLLHGHTPEAGGLSYDIMFNVARRQLLQGLNVICDSPLSGSIAYEHALAIAAETGASLAIVECRCSDEELWSRRIDERKALQLPDHHQTDWQSLKAQLPVFTALAEYPISVPLLVVDTARPLAEYLPRALAWLAQLQEETAQTCS